MASGLVSLFLAGDVMTGRGIDQVLPHPGAPGLAEPYVRDARQYVALAEEANGPIRRPVGFDWPWGDAVEVLDELVPDVRVINLETSITTSRDADPGKAVHYRMHPDNLPCLTAIRPDVCVLANNHVLDYGRAGLQETLDVLSAGGIGAVGAGRDVDEACRPAVVDTPDGARVVVSAAAHGSSGVPRSWAAAPHRPGVAVLPDLSDRTAAALVRRTRGPHELTVVSLHWGSNWGYDVSPDQVRFAHRLIDAGADVVFGHSSHHPRPIETYGGRLILYGCGDLIDDYEGIAGNERYRDDLRLVYIVTLDAGSGELVRLLMVPLQARRMRLCHPTRSDAVWCWVTLDRISAPYGARVIRRRDGRFELAAHT